jgi:hypothetical protein
MHRPEDMQRAQAQIAARIAAGELDAADDPCPGCHHGRADHPKGYCVNPRSIRPCGCNGGWYPKAS